MRWERNPTGKQGNFTFDHQQDDYYEAELHLVRDDGIAGIAIRQYSMMKGHNMAAQGHIRKTG